MRKIASMFFVVAASTALAFEPSQPNPQQVDGQDTSDSCGLGWSVMSSPTILGSSVRATTNSFLPPSFSMTFGTSGCESHGFAKNEMEAVRYAYLNKDSIRNEIAEGGGEYVSGLAEVMGCTDTAMFTKVTHDNFSSISGQSEVGGIQFYKNVKQQILKVPTLARTCNIG